MCFAVVQKLGPRTALHFITSVVPQKLILPKHHQQQTNMAFTTKNNLRSFTTRTGSVKHLKDTQPSRRALFERAKSESALRSGADLKSRKVGTRQQSLRRLYSKDPQKIDLSMSTRSASGPERMLPANLFLTSHKSKNKYHEESILGRRELFSRAKSEPILPHTTDLQPYQAKAHRRYSCRSDSKQPDYIKVVATNSLLDVSIQGRKTSPIDLTLEKCASVHVESLLEAVDHQSSGPPLRKLAGSSRFLPPEDTVNAPPTISEALDDMGLFDEEEGKEENDSYSVDDPLSLDSGSRHSHQCLHFL